MRLMRRLAVPVALLCSLPLSGCFILSTTRRLPIPRPPAVVQTVDPQILVADLNQRWKALKTLVATVEIQASVLKSKEGIARDYTTFRGHILIRKPESLRVLGLVPVLGTKMFDMASDGKSFTLYIPSRNKAIVGADELKKKSKSMIENMRPSFFFDAMVVRGLEPDDWYGVVSDSETVEDAARKHLYTVPEYVLSISHRKPGSQQLIPVRVITFHRDDLLPYQQDLYDDHGNLETQVFYSAYTDFGTVQFPSKIIIRRPQEDYQIVLTVDKVTENLLLSDNQFQIEIPEGTQIQNLH